jgi:predicted nucleotidyltransferase
MREKPARRDTGSIVKVYTQEQWILLSNLREQSAKLLAALEEKGLRTIIHGSVCRGDVSAQSDIDVYISQVVSSFLVELALEQGGFRTITRELVHATPFHTIKAHIYLEGNAVVTLPLTNPAPIEREFYNFGGSLTQEELLVDKRVAGVDKRLILIEPTKEGHTETPVIGNEVITARKVGVSLKIVKERLKVLVRRDEVGRTGVYLKRQLAPEDTFEGLLKRISDRDPVVRRRVQKG